MRWQVVTRQAARHAGWGKKRKIKKNRKKKESPKNQTDLECRQGNGAFECGWQGLGEKKNKKKINKNKKGKKNSAQKKKKKKKKKTGSI
jgi:hypothetical protein